MMKRFPLQYGRVLTICLLVLALLWGGCVKPGDVDVTDVYRLQQALSERSPQDRSRGALGPIMPASNAVPALTARKDPETAQVVYPLSLRECILRALANNTDIAVVSFGPALSRQQMIQAAAAFDYTVFGSFGYDATDTARNDRSNLPDPRQKSLQLGVRNKTVTGAEWELSHTYVRSWDDDDTDAASRWYTQDLAFEVTQPLLRGAWPEVNLAELRIARLSHKISLSEFRAEVERIITDTITAYYQLVQTRQEVEIARRLLEVTEKTYQQVEKRRKIDATAVQIKQSESAVKTRQAFLLEAVKLRKDAQDNLARLLSDPQLNLVDNYVITPTNDLSTQPVEVDQEDQLMTALRLNPSLEQLRLAIQQAEINLTVAKNNLLPSLNLTAGFDVNGGSRRNRAMTWHDVSSVRYASYNVQMTFEYPLGNRSAKASLAEARLTRKEATTRLQNTADQVAQAIRERIRQIETQYEEYVVQTAALDAARSQVEALDALERLRGKLSPEFLNLKLNAQETVAQAESNQLQALVNYNTAMLDLARTTGAVLEMNQVELALPVAAQQHGLSTPLTQARPASRSNTPLGTPAGSSTRPAGSTPLVDKLGELPENTDNTRP
jgi:outer membrane protein